MVEKERNVELTARQRAVWDALQSWIEREGMPPTRAELGAVLGVAPQTADFHVRALAQKGRLRVGRKARDLELLGVVSGGRVSESASAAREHSARLVPVVGRVAAGAPLSAIQNLEETLPVPAGTQADFALRVRGDSMVEAGILDGDLVLVRQGEVAAKGDIVVALLGEGEEVEATVKRYLPSQRRIVLRPANATMEDIVVRPGDAFSLAGQVVGVLRMWG